MKKSKTKSILACAVLASVMAVGNVAWAANQWGRGTATGTNSFAWGGYDSDAGHIGGTASNNASTAFGVKTTASGTGATAWGRTTMALGSYTTAWGYETYAYDSEATAFGQYTMAISPLTTAWGESTVATSRGDTAFGFKTIAGNVKVLTADDVASGTYNRNYKAGDKICVKTTDGDKWIVLTDADVGSGGSYYNKKLSAGVMIAVPSNDAHFATAFGYQTTASGAYSTAWGGKDGYKGGTASGTASTAFGLETEATKEGATAWGFKSQATGLYSTAWGGDSNASEMYSTAWGNSSKATGEDSTAWGYTTIAGGESSTAFGFRTVASGDYSTAWGRQSNASGDGSTAWGIGTIAGKDGDSSAGKAATAYGINATASGHGATAWGGTYYSSSKTWDTGGAASGDASTAFGIGTEASGEASTAFGYRTVASGGGATAWGGSDMHSGGKALGTASTAFGEDTNASGYASTAFGMYTNAKEYGSTAYGINATASGAGSTAWGGYFDGSFNAISGGTAVGDASTAWGVKTIANGLASTTFGENSKAGGENSLAALGGTTGTWTAQPQYDSSNYKWTKTGTVSTTTGQTGKNAVAIGEGAHAKYDNSVAIGQYAVTTMTPASSVSDGADGFIDTNEFAVGGGTYTDGNSKTHVVYSRITGVADGVNAHDAVNKGQLDAAVAAGGSKVELKSGETNLTLVDGTGTDAGKKILSLSATPSFTSVTATTFKIDNDNLWDKTNGLKTTKGVFSGNVTVGGTLGVTGALNGSTATFSGAVTAGSFKINDNNLWNTDGLKAAKVTVGGVVTVDANGIAVGSKKITGLADGSTAKDSTDAVNGGQLYSATHMGTTAGNNYTASVDVVTAVGKLDTALGKYNGTDVKGTYAKTSTVAGDMLALDTQVKANTDAIGDANSGLTKDVTAIKTYVTSSGLDANNKKITKVANGEAATDAANMSQVVTQVGENLNLVAATGTGAVGKKITLSDDILLTNAGSFGIKDASSGKVVTIDKTGIVAPIYKINDTNLWDATHGLIATTGKFGGVVTISATGIAMGSQKITGLANGTEETDAVNLKQMNDAIATAGSSSEDKLKDIVSYDDTNKKFTADGVVAASGTGTDHVVTGATVYNAMYSAVGDAFTGADGSKGLKYDNTDDGKLIANVAFEGTSATFSGYVSGTSGTIDTTTDTNKYFVTGAAVYSAIKNNISYESDPKTSTDAVADAISLRSHAYNSTTYGTLIHNVQDGVADTDAVNKGQLDAATTMSEAGNNYAVNTSVTNAVEALDTALGTYNSETMKNNTYAKNGVVATDISALDTQVKKNTDAIGDATGGLVKDVTDLKTAVGGNDSGLLKDVADLKTTVGDASSGLVKDVADNATNIATNASDIDAIEATIGTYSSVKDTQGITFAKTGNITGDIKAMDAGITENRTKIGEIETQIGVITKTDNVNLATGAISTGVSVAIGKNAKAIGTNTVSIGAGSEVIGDNSIAVGNGHKVTGKNSGAFGDPNSVYADNSYAYGNDNTLGVQGQETEHTNLHAVGNNNFIQGKDTFVLGSNVGTEANPVVADNAVILGNGSAYGGKDTVSVGAEGAERKIVNVADGNVAEGSTDAVNGGQLWKVEQKIDENIQNEINTINNHIDRMGTRINKVGAGAAALAAMHPVYDEDSKLTFSAGLGSYRNEQAAAVGMFFRFSPRVMMNAGATVGNDNNMYNVGLNFALDRHVRGGLPSKAVMAKQLNSLTLENSALKEKLATMDAKMVQQGEQIAQLMAMIEELKNR